jgi:WD40 repeat protein
MAREPGVHDELVLIDQSQLRQRQRQLHAAHEQSLTRLPLELLNCLPQVHDTADGRLVLECPHITYGYGLAFTPDGTTLAATRSSRPPGIEFWSVPGWRALKPWTSSVEPLMALAFSPDGRLAATGGFGGQVAFWDFQ